MLLGVVLRNRYEKLSADELRAGQSKRTYWRTSIAIGFVVGIHVLLLAVQGYRNSPNLDEVAHLPSGYSHWMFGDFTLYRVNPPLIRMWASLPLLVISPETDWGDFRDTPFSRAEFSVGRRFFIANGTRTFWYFTLARWILIPVSLIGACVCYRWASELFGKASGLIALTLWCFCPNILAWGASITPDAGAAAFGLLAAWRFWKWLRLPTWRNALLAGLSLGLAELTKSSWIILFGLWPLLWASWRYLPTTKEILKPKLRQLCFIVCLGLYLLNLGFGFENTGQQLKEFTFVSQTLGGPLANDQGGNRFKESWLGNIPVPFPENYVRGIDVQKSDFERKKWSYLRGEQKQGGWWYYYLYAISVKTPIGFLVLFALAIGLSVASRGYRSEWRDEILIIVPAVAILILVSSQTGFSRYLRYALPVYPFIYLFTARIGVAFDQRKRILGGLVATLVGIGCASSLCVAPHSMSFFNLAIGGPMEGKYHLLDANIDWGQDVLRFKSWIETHPESQPLYTSLFTLVPLEDIGFAGERIPHGNNDSLAGADHLAAGWYAISVNDLMGYRHYGAKRPKSTQFQQLDPDQMIGYTIYIYRIEANDPS